MKLGERIQKLRKEKGYSQEEFAKHIGIGRSTLANYEQDIRKPSYVILELIAKTLNTTPSYLMGWDDNSVGKRIKQRREDLGISQEELAKRVGYKSRSTINKIEKEVNDITQLKVVEIAKALNTTPAYLMGFENGSTNERSIKDNKERAMTKKNELVIKEVEEITDKLKEYDHRTALTILEMVASLVKLSS